MSFLGVLRLSRRGGGPVRIMYLRDLIAAPLLVCTGTVFAEVMTFTDSITQSVAVGTGPGKYSLTQ